MNERERIESALRLTAPRDFNAFFTQVVIAALLTRVFLIHSVATDDTFAMRTFKAYSAAARLRVVASLCNAEIVEVL